MKTDILTISAAARILELSTSRLRDMVREGKLPAVRGSNGIRLFKRSDVERLKKLREAA